MRTLRIAIALDCWKLAIFKKALNQAGFTYKKSAGLTKDILILTVETDNVDYLAAVVKAANTTAAETKGRELH